MNRIHLIVLAVWTAFNFVEAKSVKANSEGIRAVVQLVPARNSEGFIPGAYIQDGKLKNAEGKAMQVRTRGQWKLISSESPIEPIEGSYEWIGPMVMLDRSPGDRDPVSPFVYGGTIQCRLSFGPDQKAQFADVSKVHSGPPAAEPSSGKAQFLSSGRFNFNIPPGMALNYRVQSIYGTDIYTVSLSSGGLSALWDKKREEIRAIKPAEGFSQALVREFEILPGVQAVWYIDNAYSPSDRMLMAIQKWNDHATVFSCDATAGKEEIAEKLVRNLLQFYQPGISEGFSVGEGALAPRVSLSETTRWGLTSVRSADWRIGFQSQSVHENSSFKKRNLSEEKDFAKATGGKLTVLKKSKRTVAGLSGQEIRISMMLPEEGTLVRFTWDFKGVSRDSTQPRITIWTDAPESDLPELERMWDSLLNSIHARPRAAQ